MKWLALFVWLFALELMFATPDPPGRQPAGGQVTFYDNVSPVRDPATCRLALPAIPNPPESVYVWIGGLLQQQRTDYGVAGKTLVPALANKETWCTSNRIVVSFRVAP